MLCFFGFISLRLVYQVLPVSLDCLFLISPLVSLMLIYLDITHLFDINLKFLLILPMQLVKDFLFLICSSDTIVNQFYAPLVRFAMASMLLWRICNKLYAPLVRFSIDSMLLPYDFQSFLCSGVQIFNCFYFLLVTQTSIILIHHALCISTLVFCIQHNFLVV